MKEKKMKKIFALILVAAMCLPIVGCESTNQTQLQSETLELLNSAYGYYRTGMGYMLKAWAFSVENTSSKSKTLWDEFALHMLMTDDEIANALVDECGMTLEQISLGNDPSRGLNKFVYGFYFREANYSVNVAKYQYLQRNKVDIGAKLQQIKENLNQIDQTSDAYDILKEYYLMVCEMQEWVESPSGSYSSSSSNLQKYEKNSEKYKLELDLIIN